MCILFLYNGSNDEDSDYSLILASNRDEYYHLLSQSMAPWTSDPLVIAGRHLESDIGVDATWLAVSPARGKLGVLLNLPEIIKENAKSRGTLVADFIKSDKNTKEYIEQIKGSSKEYNGFLFVTVEFGKTNSIYTYTNASEELSLQSDTCLGFGNSLPESPLTKVEAGRRTMMDLCKRFNKISAEKELTEKLIDLLKSDVRHLPDPQLQTRRPAIYKELSSLFVRIPEGSYGTRTHTIILVTKLGRVSILEITMRSPVDMDNPHWERNEFEYNITV